MAIIDIGGGAISRETFEDKNITFIDVNNPSNDSGVLSSMSFWYYSSASGVLCGTFFGSSENYTKREYVSIGAISAGSKQTFSGISCQVSINDLLGVYASAGYIMYSNTSYLGVYRKNGSSFELTGVQNYSPGAGDGISIEAIGATVATGNKWNGITISKWNGALVSKINNI